MEIRWFGTAALSISAAGESILFDPFISMNRSIRHFKAEDFAGFSDIFITHGHFDHLLDIPRIVKMGGARVYCPETSACTLIREGVESGSLVRIAPGDRIELGPFTIRVMKGKHVKFDRLLVLKTLISPRIVAHFKNFRGILKESSRYPGDEVLVFEVSAGSKKILHMGSLNMDQEENYPVGVEVMTVPFQGRSDINRYAMDFVRRIKPGAIFLHHFDDSFPPISSQVDTNDFVEAVRREFPGAKVIVPSYGQQFSF